VTVIVAAEFVAKLIFPVSATVMPVVAVVALHPEISGTDDPLAQVVNIVANS